MLFFLFYMCGFQHTDLKSAGHGCTVTDSAETVDVCLEVLIDNDLVGVEFNLHSVKQCLIAGDTRSYLVEGL